MLRYPSLIAVIAGVWLAAHASTALPEQPRGQSHGLLGVYVVEGRRGMIILDFIPRTPADRLHRRHVIEHDDEILSLAGQPTYTLDDLRDARDSIPRGKEGKMVLRDSQGDRYHVWVAPRPAGFAAPAEPDSWSEGKRGTGDPGEDIRDARGTEGDTRPRERDDPNIRDPDVRDQGGAAKK
jgi:hypothetical protein